MNGQINNQAYYFQILFLSFPVLLGIIVALAKPLVIVNWTDRLGQWGTTKRTNYSGRKGFLSYFLRPFFWGLSKIDQWTRNIKSEFTRSGVRVSAYMYFTGIFAYLAVTVTFLIVAALVVLIAIGIATSLMSEGGGSSSGYSVRKKKVFGGDYTEHHDASGRKTGTSEAKQGFF